VADQDLQVQLDFQEKKAHKVKEAQLVLLVHEVNVDQPGQQVRWEVQVQLEKRALLVAPVRGERKGNAVRREPLEIQACKVLLVKVDSLVDLVVQAQEGLLAKVGLVDHLVLQELWEKRGRGVKGDLLAPLAHQEKWDYRGMPVRRVRQEDQAQQVCVI